MANGTGNPIGNMTVWWRPTCGAEHVEVNPPYITFDCPDGVERGWADERND